MSELAVVKTGIKVTHTLNFSAIKIENLAATRTREVGANE
jgi:hypothetical protein